MRAWKLLVLRTGLENLKPACPLNREKIDDADSVCLKAGTRRRCQYYSVGFRGHRKVVTHLSVQITHFFLKWTSQNNTLPPHVLSYWAILTSDEVPASDNLENRLRGPNFWGFAHVVWRGRSTHLYTWILGLERFDAASKKALHLLDLIHLSLLMLFLSFAYYLVQDASIQDASPIPSIGNRSLDARRRTDLSHWTSIWNII